MKTQRDKLLSKLSKFEQVEWFDRNPSLFEQRIVLDDLDENEKDDLLLGYWSLMIELLDSYK
jgi:hypothetical protein